MNVRVKILAALAAFAIPAGLAGCLVQPGPPTCTGGDQTAAAQATIDSTPDGGTVQLQGGCFVTNGSLLISGRHNLTIEGGGATIKRFVTPTGFSAQLLITGSTDIVVRDLTIDGPKPDTQGYVPAVEGQPGVDIDNSARVTFTGDTVEHTNGDGFRLSNLNDAPSILNTIVTQSGRHNVAIIGGAGTTIDHSVLSMAHRWAVDVEPNGDSPVTNVVISSSTLNGPNIGYICANDFEPKLCAGRAPGQVASVGNTFS